MATNDINRKQKKKIKNQVQNKSELEKEAQVKESDNAIFDEHLEARETDLTDTAVIKVSKIAKMANSKPHFLDFSNHSIHFHLSELFSHKKIRIAFVSVLFGLVIVITVLACIIGNKNKEIKEYERVVGVLNENLNTAKNDNSTLAKQIEELTASEQAMGEALKASSDELGAIKEEARKAMVPTAYPIKGTASIMNVGMDDEGNAAIVAVSENEVANESKEPEVLFAVTTDTSVVAAGTGTVKSVEQDTSYGYSITIEHDNGYVSIYRGAGVPLVGDGDTVTQGSVIMKIATENSVFSYQIIYDGKYIDPMTCMEING